MITYSHLKSAADSVSKIARLLGVAFGVAAFVAMYIAAHLIDNPDSGYDEEDFGWFDREADDPREAV